MKDKEIIPLLHKLRRPTFFTRDEDFYDRNLCHKEYCIIFLAVRKDEVAVFIRRLLRHHLYNAAAKRMDSVIRVSHAGLSVWRSHEETKFHYDWEM